jgi:hypothetical protein
MRNPTKGRPNENSRRYNHYCFLFETLEAVMKPFPLSHPLATGIRCILLLAILLLNFGPPGTNVVYAAPPVHDDFASAKTIRSIAYHDAVDTREATPSDTVPNVDDPDHFLCQGSDHHYGFASVWYKYTPPETQSLSLDTISTEYDTFIAVWRGARGNLSLVACNDENFEGDAELSFIAQAGITYYIEVAQFNDGTGGTSIIGGDLVFNAFITNTTVRMRGAIRGRYFVPETSTLRRSFINLTAGPVEIFNVAGNQFVASERVIYNVRGANTSYFELMGLPNRLVSTVYWLPWYNSKTLNTQLRIANITATAASVRVRIGNVEMPGSPYNLAPRASLIKTYTNIDRGPVKIISTVPVVAEERVTYRANGVNTSFTELVGLSHNQLDTIYWLPWYNSKTLNTELRIANVSPSSATVRISIGNRLVSNFTVGPGKSIRKTFPRIDKGPVKIVSNVKIIVSERVIQKVNGVPVSFSETMGLPNKQLDTIYWMPWYSKTQNIDTQLRVSNVTNLTATVHISVAGTPVPGSPFTLGPRANLRQVFANIDRGPVKIQSNVKIIAAARVIYFVGGRPTSFSEMIGLPNKLLDSRYWMPWYNNRGMNTQLRFGLP